MIKKILIIIFIMFNFFEKANSAYDKLVYEFNFDGIEGEKIRLNDYKDKVIVVVNVASRCGFTNQYEDLQTLWSNYKDKNLVIIGVPTNNFKQEPGSNKEIKDFCETNFNINFPLTEKIDVIGENAHPFFKWAKKEAGFLAFPKWNFYKYLINKEGLLVKWFASTTRPNSTKITTEIDKIILK